MSTVPIPISAEISTDLPLRSHTVQEQNEEQTIADCYDWLSFHRLWGELQAETLWSLARSLQLLKVEPGTEIYRDGQAPEGLYLLKWGSVEIFRLSQVGKTHMLYRSAGEAFGYVPLINSQGDARYQTSALALSTLSTGQSLNYIVEYYIVIKFILLSLLYVKV